MKKRTLSVLVVLSMVISMLGTALPAQAYAPPTPTAWTFMVYMAADNNLNDAAIVDLNEMEMAPSSDQVNVIALMDLYGPANTTAYRITHDTNPDAIASTVFTPPGGWSWATEANVGDPATLTEFVTKTAMAYPAQHYAVVLWNHGSGIRALTMSEPEYKYIALDETSSNSYIDIPELAGALDLVNTQIGGPLGVVAFDACLMQMAEIAHQLIGNTQMLVGSEEVVPGDGFPYDAILGDLALNPMMSCRQLSEAIVGRYAEEYAANEVYGNFTMSALDLLGMFSPGMGPISADISALGDAMATSGEWDSIFAARLTAESFNDADYIDLKDFAQRVNTMVTNPAVKAAAATLINDLGLTVFAKANGPKHPDAGGLSIYMPIAGEIDSVYSQVQFVTDTTWDEFLT